MKNYNLIITLQDKWKTNKYQYLNFSYNINILDGKISNDIIYKSNSIYDLIKELDENILDKNYTHHDGMSGFMNQNTILNLNFIYDLDSSTSYLYFNYHMLKISILDGPKYHNTKKWNILEYYKLKEDDTIIDIEYSYCYKNTKYDYEYWITIPEVIQEQRLNKLNILNKL